MERIITYFDQLLAAINDSYWVIHTDLNLRQIDEQEGYIKGMLFLYGGFVLHVAEYGQIRVGVPEILKYRYQLIDKAHTLITRWDNAPHHAEVSTYPFHKHDQNDAVVPSPAMNISLVLADLDEVLQGKL